MATNRTFKGAIKPMGASGHFNEPQRHAMQAKGFKTGNLADLGAGRYRYTFPDKGTITVYANNKREAVKEMDKKSFLKDSDRDGVPDKFDCKPNDPTKQDAPKTFRMNDKVAFVAEYKKARDGFNHFVTLYVNGEPVDTTKVHYINRTWEAYDFQSAMEQMVDKTKALTDAQKAEAREYLKKDHSDMSGFNTIANIAQLGEVFGKDTKEKNDWKERMLKAGMGDKGFKMPEDWDKLDEKTKEARLNKVIAVMKEPSQRESSPPTYEIEQEYELEPRYDSRGSFYKKANVRGEDGKTILRSYNTDVAYIKDGKAVVKGTYSPTTTRHIKEFLKQKGFKAESSKQIMKDYGEKSG